MDRQIDPNSAIDFIIKHGEEFAQTKADRVYIEQFLKSKKAMLMNDCRNETVSKAEAYALAHADYRVLLDGLKAAVLKEETLKWHLEAARLRTEVWRTQEASNRHVVRSVR